MSLMKQAEDLLVVAAQIEKQAAEVTTFVCASCNHTTTLAKINSARKTVASEIGENVIVSDIAVSDKVKCPAPGCEGVLAYQETEASKPYYYEETVAAKEEVKEEVKEDEKEVEAKAHSEKTETAEEEAAESLETQKEERAQGKHASVDYDAIDRYIKG